MVDTIFVLVSASCYPRQIEPAALKFTQSGDARPIAELLRQGQTRLRGVPADQNPRVFPGQSFDGIQGALDIIEGREFYGPSSNHKPPRKGAPTSKADLKSYIETQVYDLLFWSHCVVYNSGVPPRLVLTRGRLLPYLYEHSEALEKAFTGGLHGKALRMLHSSELLSREDAAAIAGHLERVPAPNDVDENRKAQAKLDALRQSGDRAFVSSQFADALGEGPSVQMSKLKQMLAKALSSSEIAIVQRIE